MGNITPKEAIKYLIPPIATSTEPSAEYLKQKEAYELAIKALERPTGDLISREALKDITYINKGNFNTVEGIREWIDNAPTVNTNAIADNEKSQGDLISREALRKEVTEKVNFTTVDGHIAYDKMLKLIDNAQAIPLPNEQVAWEQGYEAGLAQGKNDRPQGEWLFKHNSSDIWCSVCDENFDEIPQAFNFCPNCGACMQKGGAE